MLLIFSNAYIICIDLLHDFAPSNNSHWNLKVPQCLPKMVNLSNRGISCNKSCVSCDILVEFLMQIFFVCSKVFECWDRIGIGNIIRDPLLGASNFFAMLFDLFHRLHEQDRPLATMIFWSLWKSRNTKLWGAINISPTFIVSRAHDVLHEWSCMQRTKQPATSNAMLMRPISIILGLNMFLVPINIPTIHFSLSKIFLQLLVPKKFPSSLLVPPLK